MKKIALTFTILFSLILSNTILCQNHNGLFGNEWINFSQDYYKIKVLSDGMYRIDASTLQNSGISLSNLTSTNIQIFHNGQEIPIYVGTNNGSVDYIEFYGRKNRGDYDVNLFKNPNHHFNPEFSTITDTAAYFLTWNNSSSTRRFNDRSANLSNLPAKENYYMHRGVTVITGGWQRGKEYSIAGQTMSKASFEFGEGWGSAKSANQNQTLYLAGVYNSGPDATCSVRMYSVGQILHNIEFRTSNTLVHSASFVGDSVCTHSFNIPMNLVSLTMPINIRGTNGSLDQHSVSYLDVVYPRIFNFGANARYYFKVAASNSRKFLEIDNFDGTGANAQTIFLYDLTNNLRIQCFWDGSRVLTDLPPSTTERELVLVNTASPNAYTQVGRLQEANFIDYSNANGDYIIISHPSLRRNSQGNDPVLEYAAYRASTGYNPVVIEIEDVCNQFSYGINMHPVAIRNLAAFAKLNWSDPKFIFLIGKGRVYNTVRNFNTFDHLIPTFGYPPSDQLMVAPFDSDVPLIPIGRLAAVTGDQVSVYLQKIRDIESFNNAPETVTDRAWTKNVIHLGGGIDQGQQNVIRVYLDDMARIIRDTLYGANVTSFYKSSTNPIQAAQSAFLDSLINDGVSLITFFGHSSTNSFDFNLDRPENYRNYQKYPMIISLGCYGGTIYESGTYISEQFVFEPEAGAMAFLAPVGIGVLSTLNYYTNKFYTVLNSRAYNKGIGKCLQETIEALENSSSYNGALEIATHIMTYHGDPAFNLNMHPGPDYYIDENLVSHSPNTVTTQMNNFELKLSIFNLGSAKDTVFYVEVNREFPNGFTDFVSRQRFSAPFYNDSITISVPVGGIDALGINYFNIEIDSEDEIAESPNPGAEQNNTVLRYPVQIVSEAIIPVFPKEFAIVNSTPVALKASTGNTNAQLQNYRIQIDTSEYFNSPLLRDTNISIPGGLLEWTPAVNYNDSTVYYWRVSVDSVNAAIGFNWIYSSFIFINGSFPGWNQSHFFQYKKDKFNNIELFEPSRAFNYITTFQEISIRNGFTPNPLHPEDLALYLNGSRIDRCRCGTRNGTYVTVVDSSNLDIWTLAPSQSRFGAINCDAREAFSFFFETTNPIKQAALEVFLRDSIPDGFYVLLHSMNDASASTWNSSLISYLQSQGSTLINDLAAVSSGLPWAFYYSKNDASFQYRQEKIAASNSDNITMDCLIPGRWKNGKLESTFIGPAENWQSFHWRVSGLDTALVDELSVDVYGVDSLRVNRTLLLSGLEIFDTLLTQIDASVYPYLQLVWNTEDAVNYTSAQLDYWRVLADFAPDAALRPDIYSFITADTIQQGIDFNYEVMIQNISTVDMDSILLKYHLIGQPPQYKRLAPLAAGDTIRSTILNFPTIGLSGPQQLFVEINPDNDQRELYFFNNTALISFFVQGDVVNPLLDVTFDGIRIMNGDLVSGKPEIVVTLSDENKWLGLDDLNDFKITLRNPNFTNGETLLTPTADVVKNLIFLPADSSNLAVENKAQIIMELDLPWDGDYTLFVSATDKSGNNSGNLDYSVDFEIINGSSISNVLNYPNPFTSKTNFVFTLTGREIPEFMKIQIFTVSGKLVKEIGQDEIGPINIGVNKTIYAWDGTDQFGDRLANGVYLYRVSTKMKKEDDETLKLYNNSDKVSSMFNNGFGKMYLMR